LPLAQITIDVRVKLVQTRGELIANQHRQERDLLYSTVRTSTTTDTPFLQLCRLMQSPLHILMSPP
jgi:hypothetical protein